MELTLKNIGIIKDSTIKLDGLTVITGPNNSGKSTVGKVLYSLIKTETLPASEYQNEINHLKYSIQDGKIFANDIPDARQEIMEYEFMIKTITEAANKLKEELNDKRGR